MRSHRVLLSLLLLAGGPRVAHAGLDLTWSTCNSGAGTDNIVLNCATASTVKLFANFQSTQNLPGFNAMDAVLDIRSAGGTLAPFWHFETGGCNEFNLFLSDGKPAVACPDANNANPWGPGGQDAISSVTWFDNSRGPDRVRILLTIGRTQSLTIPVGPGLNYFGFELDIATGNAGACDGCATPAVIAFTEAILYSATQAVVVHQSGLRSATVAVNGGIPGPTLFEVRPQKGDNAVPASVEMFGRNLVAGTTARLTRSGQSDITGTGTTTSPKGDLVTATFDIVDRLDGNWNVQVTDPSSMTDGLANTFRTVGDFEIDALTPSLGYLGLPATVTIQGSELIAPASVRLVSPLNPGIEGSATTVAADGTSLQTTFDLGLIAPGVWDVVVTNGDGTKNTLPGAFVVAPRVRVWSVSPSVAADTGPVVLSVGGSGLRSGASVSLRREGEADIVGDQVTVDPLGKSLRARFDLTGRARGNWDLVIVNAGATPVIAGNVLRIADPLVADVTPRATETLALTSVSPNPTAGRTSVTFTLPGETAIRLTVVDLQGRERLDLAGGVWPPGRHEIRWDARERALAAGMYFLRLEAAGRAFEKRFVVAR